MDRRADVEVSPLQKATLAFAEHGIGAAGYDVLNLKAQVKLEEATRATFLSVRNPSAAMMQAARTVELPHGYRLTELEAMLVWERMIDAIVSEG